MIPYPHVPDVLQQIRPQTGGDRRMYNPDRDLAYAGPAIIREALTAFEHFDVDQPAYTKLLAGIPVEQLSAGIEAAMRALGQGVLRIYREDPESPDAAFSEFNQLSPEIQTLVAAQLGLLLLGRIYTDMRSVHFVDDPDPPHRAQVMDIVRASGGDK